MESIRGWLLIYLIGTGPVLAFWSAGLSGWVLDYPLWLFLSIFTLFLVPLLLLILKVPSAPVWNIAMLWSGTILLCVRIFWAIVQMDRALEQFECLIMAAIVCGSFAWVVPWTCYFLVSRRVAEIYR